MKQPDIGRHSIHAGISQKVLCPSYIHILFEDFYRSPNVKKDFEGTGLGLSVVNRIVRAHHGKAWAESVPKQGTTFFVGLPIGRLSQPPRG